MTATAMREGAAPRQKAGPVGVTSWMLFDWAAQPFYTLITIFLFAPYFTNVFIGDVAQGAAIWGYTKAASAIIVGLGSPILGALADAKGRLKPMLFLWSVLFVIGQSVLWYAVPGGADPYLWIVVAGLVVTSIAGEFTALLNNSIMPRIAAPGQFGRISGGGAAIGYIGGLVSLFILAGFVLTDVTTGRTLLGLEPLFALDRATHEAERFVGPFCAAWYALFVIPFFLFTPDAPAMPHAKAASVRTAMSSVLKTLSHIRRYRQIMLFLVARMLFFDGLLAVFAFGGIYAASVFAWQTIAIGYFGIILSVAAGIGAVVGGFLDDRLGSKRVIIGSLLLLIVGTLGMISVDRTHVLFVLEITPKTEGSAAFASPGEQVYLAFALLIGVTSGPLQSVSRSLLAHMAPTEHISKFFGIFAFSGKVTAFAAPLIIGALSAATGSLQLAMCAILPFLFVGLAIMMLVQVQRAS